LSIFFFFSPPLYIRYPKPPKTAQKVPHHCPLYVPSADVPLHYNPPIFHSTLLPFRGPPFTLFSCHQKWLCHAPAVPPIRTGSLLGCFLFYFCLVDSASTGGVQLKKCFFFFRLALLLFPPTPYLPPFFSFPPVEVGFSSGVVDQLVSTPFLCKPPFVLALVNFSNLKIPIHGY